MRSFGSMHRATASPPPSTPNFASFGPGSSVVEPYRITCAERIHIGANVQIAAGSWLSVVDEHMGRRYDPCLLIGDGASLGPDIVVACMGRVEIGPRVLTGSRVFIGDTYHDYRDPHAAVIDQPMRDPDPVYIGAGAFLGIGSIVLPGTIIGERAYVAAGAVVTTDVASSTVVAGNPARVIKRWDEKQQRWVSTGSPRDTKPNGGSANGDGAHPHVAAVEQAPLERAASVTDLEHRAALAEAEHLACEEEVRALSLERDRTLALLEDARRAQAGAELWLEDHRRSVSWRVTAPLRAVRRTWARSARQVRR